MSTNAESLQLSRQHGRGRDADTPTEIPPAGWRDVLWRVYQAINEDRVMLTAAGVTYYLLLALVPTLSAIVSIYGLFADRATVIDHVDMLRGLIPSGGLEIIRDQLTRLTSTGDNALGITLLVSLAIALWSGSAGINSLFDAMNVAYQEEEKRNFFLRTLLALVFTLAGALAAVLVIAVVVVLPGLVSVLPLANGVDWVIRITGYLLMLAVLVMALAALYRWGPSREDAKWRWITPGAILSVLMTIVVSVLFSWYVSDFGNYNATYGSLGALIGFLTWVWLSTIIVIIGGELNSEVEHQTAQDSTTGAPMPLGKRGAHMADTVGRPWRGAPDKPDHETDEQFRARPRRPFSAAALALALPAALVLRATRRRGARN